jgi:hypothetical protein
VSPGIPGEDVGVAGRVNVTACRRLASVRIRCQVHLEVFSAIAFADDRRYPLAGPARALGPRSPPALSPGTAAFPAADTEAGCPQSLGREAGILAGVLEATACDPPKSKPTRQTT